MRLDTLLIYVRDLRKASDFYAAVFGTHVEPLSPEFASMGIGTFRVGLHLGEPGRGTVPCWQASDLNAFAERVIMAGGSVRDERHETPRGWIVDCADPDGNPFQAIQLKGR